MFKNASKDQIDGFIIGGFFSIMAISVAVMSLVMHLK